MDALFELAQKHNARVLLLGDTRQHKSVESGDALRLLEDYFVIAKVELSTITRQKHALYRDAVQSLANGEVLKASMAAAISSGGVTVSVEV